MLKRVLGEVVFINPYYNTTGTIIDTKELKLDQNFNSNFDYKVKWNQKMEHGEWEYFNDDELEKCESNWNMVKSVF
ncbi:hypothetical protein AB1L07_02185 [Niallia alba]|uniref:hypothetical protein n=1 Tax=Niallia alba TaxID=2729105 RepID=UPI0039A30922